MGSSNSKSKGASHVTMERSPSATKHSNKKQWSHPNTEKKKRSKPSKKNEPKRRPPTHILSVSLTRSAQDASSSSSYEYVYEIESSHSRPSLPGAEESSAERAAQGARGSTDGAHSGEVKWWNLLTTSEPSPAGEQVAGGRGASPSSTLVGSEESLGPSLSAREVRKSSPFRGSPANPRGHIAEAYRKQEAKSPPSASNNSSKPKEPEPLTVPVEEALPPERGSCHDRSSGEGGRARVSPPPRLPASRSREKSLLAPSPPLSAVEAKSSAIETPSDVGVADAVLPFTVSYPSRNFKTSYASSPRSSLNCPIFSGAFEGPSGAPIEDEEDEGSGRLEDIVCSSTSGIESESGGLAPSGFSSSSSFSLMPVKKEEDSIPPPTLPFLPRTVGANDLAVEPDSTKAATLNLSSSLLRQSGRQRFLTAPSLQEEEEGEAVPQRSSAASPLSLPGHGPVVSLCAPLPQGEPWPPSSDGPPSTSFLPSAFAVPSYQGPSEAFPCPPSVEGGRRADGLLESDGHLPLDDDTVMGESAYVVPSPVQSPHTAFSSLLLSSEPMVDNMSSSVAMLEELISKGKESSAAFILGVASPVEEKAAALTGAAVAGVEHPMNVGVPPPVFVASEGDPLEVGALVESPVKHGAHLIADAGSSSSSASDSYCHRKGGGGGASEARTSPEKGGTDFAIGPLVADEAVRSASAAETKVGTVRWVGEEEEEEEGAGVGAPPAYHLDPTIATQQPATAVEPLVPTKAAEHLTRFATDMLYFTESTQRELIETVEAGTRTVLTLQCCAAPAPLPPNTSGVTTRAATSPSPRPPYPLHSPRASLGGGGSSVANSPRSAMLVKGSSPLQWAESGLPGSVLAAVYHSSNSNRLHCGLSPLSPPLQSTSLIEAPTAAAGGRLKKEGHYLTTSSSSPAPHAVERGEPTHHQEASPDRQETPQRPAAAVEAAPLGAAAASPHRATVSGRNSTSAVVETVEVVLKVPTATSPSSFVPKETDLDHEEAPAGVKTPGDEIVPCAAAVSEKEEIEPPQQDQPPVAEGKASKLPSTMSSTHPHSSDVFAESRSRLNTPLQVIWSASSFLKSAGREYSTGRLGDEAAPAAVPPWPFPLESQRCSGEHQGSRCRHCGSGGPATPLLKLPSPISSLIGSPFENRASFTVDGDLLVLRGGSMKANHPGGVLITPPTAFLGELLSPSLDEGEIGGTVGEKIVKDGGRVAKKIPSPFASRRPLLLSPSNIDEDGEE